MPISSTACAFQNTFVCGDPEFKGFLGQKYEVHGVPNSVFNIITSPRIQYNALFVYIGQKSSRQCNDTRTHPWTHAGTYLGTLGFKTVAGDRIKVIAGTCTDGIKSVTLNGKALTIGPVHQLAAVEGHKQSVQYKDAFTLVLKFAEVDITLTNSDMFFNQGVEMTAFGESQLETHGLLGQTWRERTYVTNGVRRVYEGTSTDYLVQEEDVFGDDFTFNKFPQA
jgi:hypothetical protein